MQSEDWQCELCCEPIGDAPHVRIAGDVAVRDGSDEFVSLSDDEIVVFAMFHSKCLLETMRQDFTGENRVPFLRQARGVIEKSRLCDCCDGMSRGVAFPQKRSHLAVIQGGVA
jgi:hypothetical protein